MEIEIQDGRIVSPVHLQWVCMVIAENAQVDLRSPPVKWSPFHNLWWNSSAFLRSILYVICIYIYIYIIMGAWRYIAIDPYDMNNNRRFHNFQVYLYPCRWHRVHRICGIWRCYNLPKYDIDTSYNIETFNIHRNFAAAEVSNDTTISYNMMQYIFPIQHDFRHCSQYTQTIHIVFSQGGEGHCQQTVCYRSQ